MQGCIDVMLFAKLCAAEFVVSYVTLRVGGTTRFFVCDLSGRSACYALLSSFASLYAGRRKR